MINKIIIKFKECENFRYNFSIGSIMQGILMERLPVIYANKLHISGIHPYSQHTEYHDGSLEWTVTALSDEAIENIIPVLLSDEFDNAELKNKDITLAVESKELFSVSYDELFNKSYLSDSTFRYIDIEFITPGSFKYDGKYAIFPTAQMIIKNLIRKYDASSETTEITDDALIELVEKSTDIVEYNLRSVKYMLEGIKIPAFTGRLTLKINGAPEFIRLINMLLEFGEYSGTGIKTAMGMGSYKITGKRGQI